MQARLRRLDEQIGERGFSGVVSISFGSVVEFERAYGFADRSHGIACTPDTTFGIASATKGLTALVIASLVADRLLEMHTTARPAGSRFAYNNSGYATLAILAERAGGAAFPQLVHDRVTAPAGMADTGFPRSDELPRRAASGYLAMGVSTSSISRFGAAATVAPTPRLLTSARSGRHCSRGASSPTTWCVS